MQTLPVELLPFIIEFEPLFSKPVWPHAKLLLVGAILAIGKRTVTSCLRVMGLVHEKAFQNYHRVLNRAHWSALAASRILLRLLVAAFAPTGELVCGALAARPPSGLCRRQQLCHLRVAGAG